MPEQQDVARNRTTIHKHNPPMTIKINTGSGSTPGSNGWINIDLKAGADLNHDLSSGLPFADGEVDTIYTAHFLEHLTHQQICCLLKDCHRALRPGGRISICVPNARRFIHAYINEEMQSVTLANGENLKIPEFPLLPGEGIYAKTIVNTGSPIDWVNYIAHSNSEHN